MTDVRERPTPELTGAPAAVRITGHALLILAGLCLLLLTQAALIGAVQHGRDQALAYADFRNRLANAVAPVGPLDDGGHLLAPGTPVAVLSIPKLGLDEVVGEGTSAGALKSGPGHRRDTVLPGQAGTSVVMGRRAAYGGPFARLGELTGGDRITVTTGQGAYGFEVTGVRRANDPQPLASATGKGRLTLVTADGPAYLPADVLRVDARLLGPAAPGGTRLPAYALPESEQAMAGDGGALVPLVGWGVVLALAAAGVVHTYHRFGTWHAWVIGVPLLGALGLAVADHVVSLLPNLL
ncbi:sortase [Amycolatopsis cynarae]|uniref:Sortase n=1 Tax=Amycolatopsis cynarae TaxID=2995223 RepID=A0ABY7BAC6_9PSEU|nr:sortase [Amycolatopsis sp. HUAS 11-8]WAL68364.1 sortase [Amycolatopsis sp. HUAS 11-8]